MSNLDIYNKAASVPENAKKPISAGRLKGMTDINPMWRIKMLTELFGMCGVGWKYVITEKRIVEGADGAVCAFVDIDLFVKNGDEWSEAIQGTGGSQLVSIERNGKYTNDECFKMALTDALSVACKALGFGADVYWADGRTKYSGNDTGGEGEKPKQEGEKPKQEGEKPKQQKPKKETPRDRLIAKLKEKGIDVNAYAQEKGLAGKVPDSRFEELLAELEG